GIGHPGCGDPNLSEQARREREARRCMGLPRALLACKLGAHGMRCREEAGQVSGAATATIHVGRAGCAPWQFRASRMGSLAILLNGSSWRALVQKLGVEDVETEMVTHAAGTEMRGAGVGAPLAWGGAMVSNEMPHALGANGDALMVLGTIVEVPMVMGTAGEEPMVLGVVVWRFC
ncbi:unnamed protein product, partial [Ilex paraguariensis]